MDIFNKLQVTIPTEMGDLSFFYGVFAFLLIFIFGSLLLTDLVIPNNLVKLAANIYVIGLGLYILFSIKTDVSYLDVLLYVIYQVTCVLLMIYSLNYIEDNAKKAKNLVENTN